MARSEATDSIEARRARGARFSFRVDVETKALVERAAELERRNLTDFCLIALADAARETISRHETLVLSERDRAVFFDTLVNRRSSTRGCAGAFAAARLRVES
jgi:uncharacterized protein (DUF1778 family)